VREAIINAVTHADYSQIGAPIRVSVFDDRVEVESPGLLPFGLTVDDMLQGVSRLRNRVIGRVFKEVGLIEQWGSGVGRMVDCCREQGIPGPEFEELASRFRVIFRLTRVAASQLNETELSILNAVRCADGLSTGGVAEAVGISSRAARTRLKQLVARGVIVEVGSSPTDPKRVYLPADRGPDVGAPR
jgi:predicted HTH transcriptional regulator